MDLLCWGTGEVGQSGQSRPNDTSPEESLLPEFTETRLGRVRLFACGSSHSIVVTEHNKLYAWGNGTSGQLGDGEGKVKKRPSEVKLSQQSDGAADRIVGVACGSRHSFVWTDRGHAYCFGNNYYAQLGYDYQRSDFKENQMAPRLCQSLTSSKISQVACGERHTLFAVEDGAVAACGQNDYGQLGCGFLENAVIPHFVDGLDNVSKVICGANHNLALTVDGKLFQWGCGKACGSFKRDIFCPEVITSSSQVKDMAGGASHSLLLTDGGEVFSWGMGHEGQLGLGEDEDRVSTPCFLRHSLLAHVTQIRAGDSYSAAVTAGGELFLWGLIPSVSWVSDQSGPKRFWTPQVASLAGRKVTRVACGTWHMIALTTKQSGEWGHSTQTVTHPAPLESMERESRVQKSCIVAHKMFQKPEGPTFFKECGEDCEIQQKDGSTKNGEDLTSHDSAFSGSSFTRGRDRTAKGYSSAYSTRQQARKRTQRAINPESREVVFTSVQLLPRNDGTHVSSASSLVTGRPSLSDSLPKLQGNKSPPFYDFIQKSGTNTSLVHSSGLRPKPPGRSPGLQTTTSCHHSAFASTIQQVLLADPSLPRGCGCETKSRYKLPHWSLPHALARAGLPGFRTNDPCSCKDSHPCLNHL